MGEKLELFLAVYVLPRLQFEFNGFRFVLCREKRFLLGTWAFNLLVVVTGFDRVVAGRLFVGSSYLVLMRVILTLCQLICHHGGFRKVAVPVDKSTSVH